MAREPVFYSFHFDNDVHRVMLIRQMGVIEGDEPVEPNEWERLRSTGGVERWIDSNMKDKTCAIVLIGSETSERPWVKHEIKRAWEMGKGLLGIYIHNLRCMRRGFCSKGRDPFLNWNVGSQSMANLVTCYDPPAGDAYNHIAGNLQKWVSAAIAQARAR